METQNNSQGYLYTFYRRSFPKGTANFEQIDHPPKKGVILAFIADDHPYLIHGVEIDLNKDSKIKIVGTASSYDEVLRKIVNLQIDIILLDLRMPGHEKYELSHFINNLKEFNKCKVVIFSNETGWARIHRCIEMGASAYIEKAISIGRLTEFIHRVHENSELLIFTAEALPHIQFSKRQIEILHYIVDGKENNEIASALNIELKTVQSYLNEIKSKLSESFNIFPIRPRTLLLLASKLGFGSKVA